MAIFFEIVAAILLADWITGFVHWWEDAYGNPTWRVIGKYIVEPNLVHHLDPRDLAPAGYFKLTHISWIFAGLLIAVPWLAADWHPFLYLATILIAAQANQVHCWAHRTDKENGRLVRAMQRTGIIQSRRHHGQHHRPPWIGSYCILTNYMNPVLDRVDFWNRMERLLARVLGIELLRGSPVRNGL